MRLASIRHAVAALLAAALLAGSAATLAAQQTADIIRGRITSSEGAPIANAQVTAISYFGGITKSTRTGRDGRYSIVFPNGEGDYWISVAAIGYQGQRTQLKRVADEEVLVADLKLSNAQVLQTVTTTANAARQPPPRDDRFASDPSGADRSVSTGGVLVAPDQMGNLAAMAATMPGVQLIPGVDGNPDRFSMFGLDPTQNNATLNGQQAGLSTIPRDAAAFTQVRAGYDVANGGFSGAQVAVTTSSGSNYINRTMSGFFNAPQAQFNDPVGRATNFGSLSVSGRASGPIVMDKDFYSVSFQLDRREQRLPTLLSSTPLVFQSAGISADSAARLRSILGTLGVPLAAGGLGSTSPRTSGSLLGAFDWAPKSATSGHAFTLSVNGSYSSAGPQSLAASQSPSVLSESRNLSGGAQLRHTNYFGSGILTESMIAIGGSTNETDPYLELPGGSVLVTSQLPDGTIATRSLAFGGGANAGTNGQRSLNGRNMLSWVSTNNKHRLKLITELRLDESFSERANNLFGRYTYQSLDDLAAGIPSSFSRTLNTVSQSGKALVGGVALGDAWRPSQTVQVQYGVRVDGNWFLDRPAENAAVQQALGVRTSQVPNGIYVSPRVGFSWLYGKAAQIPFADGFFSGPRATIRGGIGLFQNVRGPDLIANAIANTGLPSSQQQLTCTGAVTPAADWNRLLANPNAVASSCLDGTGGSLFSNATPSVSLFAPGFVQERSVRSNVSWNGLVLGNRFSLNANLTGSLNLNQPDVVDLNFRPQVQFTVPAEANRPVYAAAGSIAPASGLIASRDARLTTQFTGVNAQRSDLQSRTAQLSLQLSPFYFESRTFTWSAGYSFLYLSQEYRGFSNTAGDPLAIFWNPGSQPQHDLTYTLNFNIRNAVTVSWGGRLTSGQRYTPMIAGDVNGDGRANDRAFVFNPAAANDPALASAMQALLDGGSSGARSCLRRQLGRIADRNSCTGPWTSAGTNLRLTINPSKIRLPQRTTLTFTMTNPLAAADLLVNGERNLKGWGQAPAIDQSLLFVRGFDPATQRFRYDVNQRFGATGVRQVSSRSPAVLTMQVGLNLAPTRDWQNLSQTLARGRTRAGVRQTETQVRQMSTGLFPNVMQRLLSQGEQLKLSRVQADSLATMSRRFTRIVDSVWTPAAKLLAALPKDYDRREAELRLISAREVAVGYLITAAPHVRKMLTKGQLRVLDRGLLSLLEPRNLELMKSGQSGGEFGFFF